MSMMGGAGIGMTGGYLTPASTRGRVQGGGQGIAYPSPFFDVAHTYLPATVKAMFRWCRYYFLTNPLVNATVFKLSEYPITDIIIDDVSTGAREQWTNFLQIQLRYRSFQVEVGLDYHTYGNALIGIAYPFKKYLSCPACTFSEAADKCRPNWVYTNNAFRLTCPKCSRVGEATAKDIYFRNASGIRLIRWNPEDVDITYNDITGDYTYYYTIPATIRNDITVGKKDVVDRIPQLFLQAVREQKGVVFSPDNLFHLKRPTLAHQDRGWGIPLLLPVLKDAFHLQIMKKAQEAILLEHIVPLRVLFPQAGSGTTDPYTTVNLAEWREQVSREIARWRYDNNYIPILPLPIGNQTIGGDGKALLLTGEIQTWSEQMMSGMGVPREFLLGGMSYAGTNVSLRMLENTFIGYLGRHRDLLNFVIERVASFMQWPVVKGRFKPFKMADDLQKKAYDLQLNQAQKISDTTLLAGSDYDQETENQLMLKETSSRLEAIKAQQIGMATVQGEASLITAKYQVKAQQMQMTAQQAPVAPGEPGGPEDGGGGVAGGQEGGVPLPPELQVAAPGGGTVEGAPPPSPGPTEGGPSPEEYLANMGSALTGRARISPGQGDIRVVAQQQAQQIAQMPPQEQQQAIQNIAAQSPELAQMVEQLVKQMSGGKPSGGPSAPAVDARPLPEQRAPRRDNPSV
jgi:hypothetical protein